MRPGRWRSPTLTSCGRSSTRPAGPEIGTEPFDATCDYGTDGSDGVDNRVRMILSGTSGRLAGEQLRPVLGEQGWNDLLDEVRTGIRAAITDGRVQVPGRTWLVTATA